MRTSAVIRIALMHSWSTRGSFLLVFAVIILGATPMLIGLRAAEFFSHAIEQQTDLVDVRKVVVEPHSLDARPIFDKETINDLASAGLVEWAKPLIEIGVRVETASDHSGFVTIESSEYGDPRFCTSRMISGSEFESGSAPRVAIVTQGLLHDLREVSSIRARITRTIGGTQETLPLEFEIIGVSAMDGRRIFLPISTVAALDNWSAGGSFDPSMPPSPQSRAVFFATHLSSIQPLVNELQQAGWSTRHRLRDVQSMRRTNALIYSVALLATGGFLIAGLIASGVYIASTRKQQLLNTAVFRLCDVRESSAAMIVVAPLVLAAVAGFIVAVIASTGIARIGFNALMTLLDISSTADAPGAHALLVATMLTLFPLTTGLLWSFRTCWKTPVRSALLGGS